MSLITNLQNGLRVTLPGAGCIGLPAMYPYNDFGGGNGTVSSANIVYGVMVTIPYPVLWRNLIARVKGASAGSLFSIGLYNLAGQLIVSTNVMSGSVIGNVTDTLSSPYMVQPGTYFYCYTVSDPALSLIVDFGLDPRYAQLLNAFTGLGVIGGFTAAASSGGVLPATLGALTATQLSGQQTPPFSFIYS
jgi:hypothetical protein